MLVSLTSRTGPDGPAGLILVATDLTARKAQDALLAASEDRYRQTFDHAPLGVSLIDLAADRRGRFVNVNPAWAAMLGREQSGLLSQTLESLAHPEDLPKIAVAVGALASGQAAREDLELRCLDSRGGEVVLNLTASALLGPDGSAEYAVCMAQDITASGAPRRSSATTPCTTA